jgi:ribose 5-phosphate isomerase B
VKLAIASDHAGFQMKEHLKPWLTKEGHELMDLGAYNDQPSDYPDFAEAIARAVIAGRVDRGILLCGSGVGASIAANKFPGIRAALAHDAFSARQCVYDDDANVLCLGPRVIGEELAKVLIGIFLTTKFSGIERHRRRLEKLRLIEDVQSGPGSGDKGPGKE